MIKIIEIGIVFIFLTISFTGESGGIKKDTSLDKLEPATVFMIQQIQEQADAIIVNLDSANYKLDKYITKKSNHVNINHYTSH